jgi:hypothetical protein
MRVVKLPTFLRIPSTQPSDYIGRHATEGAVAWHTAPQGRRTS